MAKSPREMEAAMIANLPEKTGKPLAEWLKVVRASGLAKHGQIVKHLKTEHGMTHGFANLVAHKARQDGAEPKSDDDLVAAQYAGGKAALRPIYDAVLEVVGAFGDDVEVAPKKTYVSLRRSKQFALVQPSTKTRVDVGLCLKGVEASGRLEASRGNAMVSHRIRVTEPSEVDGEVVEWLRRAYERA